MDLPTEGSEFFHKLDLNILLKVPNFTRSHVWSLSEYTIKIYLAVITRGSDLVLNYGHFLCFQLYYAIAAAKNETTMLLCDTACLWE